MSTEKSKDAGGEPKKGKGLMIGLIAGGAVLLCCCCPSTIGTGWWGYSTFLSGPPFVGTWEAKHPDNQDLMVLRVNNDAKGTLTIAKGNPIEFKWNIVDDKKVQFDSDASKRVLWTSSTKATFDYTVDGNRLTLNDKKNNKTVTFERK